ncbi:hypothetical protein [uncultured Amphritea sp.]|uniref:hypothetical protein n=1 Tax=uncultured Amphritea sp. TaxID=981605 RepID=UPI00260B1A30|nr:hypothetical protein [uncultured Amphritea sp.]
MMIVVFIFGLAFTGYMNYAAKNEENDSFYALGSVIAEHSTAITEWVVDQGATALSGTYTGTNWLKSNSDCGITTGGTTAYLPCSFSFTTSRFGGSPTSVVTNSGGVTTVVTTWPALVEGSKVKVIGAARVVREAQATNRDSMHSVVTYSEDINGVITATISVNNATSIYVKRAGDSMNGSLDMGGNNLDNVGVITASTGTFNTSSLGNASASSFNTNNVIATNGTITTLDSTTLTATNGTITNLGATDTSTSNLTVSGTATIDQLSGNLKIQKIRVVGDACSGNGQMAMTATDDLLSCVNGNWKGVQGAGGLDYRQCYGAYHGTNVAYNACPTGYVFRGGYRRGSDSGEWNGFNCCKLK